MNFGFLKDYEYAYKPFWIITLFHQVFEYSDGAEFLGYVGTNESFYVELLNNTRKIGRLILSRSSCFGLDNAVPTSSAELCNY